MVHTLATLREFHTPNFTVRCTAEDEYDLDLSWDEDGSIREGLESGKYVAFCAAVKVYFKGEEIAADYLGNCIYESFEKFMDHRECGKINKEYAKKGQEGRCGSYFKDMIGQAIKEARRYIKDRKKEYRKIHVR